MQQGLGRTGYLLLTFTFLAVGALGIAMTVLAFTQGVAMFGWMGVGLAGFGLLCLFLFAVVAPVMEARAHKAPEPQAAPVPEPQPEARPEVEFEFKDPEPAPRAAPEQMMVPNAFQDARPPAPERDAAAWPGQRDKSTWTRKMEHEAKVRDQVEESPVRRQMADRYTRSTPTVRAILSDTAQATQAPTQIAERAPEGVAPGFAAPGLSVGSCGRCSTMLMAPPTRPVRLKCPECAKITLLE